MASVTHTVVQDNTNVLEIRLLSPSPMFAPATLLQDFVTPLTSPQFLSEIFRKKCLLIRDGGESRFADLYARELCGLDLKSLLAASTSERVFCWSKRSGTGIVSIEVDTVDAAMSLYEAGASLCFRSPRAFLTNYVLPMSQHVRMGFGATHIDGTCHVPHFFVI